MRAGRGAREPVPPSRPRRMRARDRVVDEADAQIRLALQQRVHVRHGGPAEGAVVVEELHQHERPALRSEPDRARQILDLGGELHGQPRIDHGPAVVAEERIPLAHILGPGRGGAQRPRQGRRGRFGAGSWRRTLPPPARPRKARAGATRGRRSRASRAPAGRDRAGPSRFCLRGNAPPVLTRSRLCSYFVLHEPVPSAPGSARPCPAEAGGAPHASPAGASARNRGGRAPARGDHAPAPQGDRRAHGGRQGHGLALGPQARLAPPARRPGRAPAPDARLRARAGRPRAGPAPAHPGRALISDIESAPRVDPAALKEALALLERARAEQQIRRSRRLRPPTRTRSPRGARPTRPPAAPKRKPAAATAKPCSIWTSPPPPPRTARRRMCGPGTAANPPRWAGAALPPHAGGGVTFKKDR
jgi:hypothetical protein